MMVNGIDAHRYGQTAVTVDELESTGPYQTVGE